MAIRPADVHDDEHWDAASKRRRPMSKITFTMDRGLQRELKVRAAQRDLTMSEMVERAVRMYLNLGKKPDDPNMKEE